MTMMMTIMLLSEQFLFSVQVFFQVSRDTEQFERISARFSSGLAAVFSATIMHTQHNGVITLAQSIFQSVKT